ncbi:MAG: glycosyltransferase [Nitrospirae bacterium]|nr:glycosyltransferase [Nitrospirota bacterium]
MPKRLISFRDDLPTFSSQMTSGELFDLAGGFGLLGGLLGVVFDGAALFGADRLLRSRRDIWMPDGALPPVVMIKPVRGLDHGARDNYLSFIHQDYPSFRILFTVDSPADPAASLIRELEREFPDKVELVVVSERTGQNRKMNKVAAVAREILSSSSYILVNDSDIRVPPSYLREIMRPMLADPKVGAVTCMQRGIPEGGFPSRLAALMLNSEAIPQGLVAYALLPLTYLYGPTMLFSAEALRSIGGFDAMKDYLADDYHLGRLIHEKGYRIVLSHLMVDARIRDESLSGVIAHEVRWARTYSSLRPLGYTLSIFSRPFLFCLLAVILGGIGGNPAIAFGAVGLYVLHLALTSYLLREIVGHPLSHKDLSLWISRELLSLYAYLMSFGRSILWRGYRYRILPGGALRPLDPKSTTEAATH